jgi:phosphatidylglycerophosphate synthase
VRKLAAAQKSAVGVSLYSRWLNRPAGRYLAAASFKLGMTPNQVTAVSACLTFAGILLLATAPATIGTGLLVACLLALGYAVDSADGQLARLRGGGTPAGEWLDHIVDSVKMATLHIAVLIGWYRFFDVPAESVLLIPLLFAVQSSVFFFALILSEQLRRAATGDRSRPSTHAPNLLQRLQSLAVLPADYGLHCWMFLLWGFSAAFMAVYSVMAAVNIVLLAIGLVRWFCEMRRLTTP